MKLSQLQEARYAVHPVINWIEDHMSNRNGVRTYNEFRHVDLKNDEHEQAAAAITRRYGQPRYVANDRTEWKVSQPPRSQSYIVTVYQDGATAENETGFVSIYEP